MAFPSLSQRVFADEHVLSKHAICPTMDLVLLQEQANISKANLWRVAGSAGKVWDCTLPADAEQCCWAPDGQYVVCAHKGQADLISVHTGNTVISLHSSSLSNARNVESGKEKLNASADGFIAWRALEQSIASTSKIHAEELIKCLPALPTLRDRKAPVDTFLANAYGTIPKAAVSKPKLSLDAACRSFPHLPPAHNAVQGEAVGKSEPSILFHRVNDTELRLYYGGCLDIGCIRVPADADIVSVDILPSEEGADQDACTIAILWASRIDHTLNFSRLSLDLPLVSIDRLARAYTAVHALLKHVYEAIADHIDQWAEAKAVGQKWCDRIDGASSTYHLKQSPTLQMLTLLLTGRGTEALSESFTLKNAERDFNKWETTFSEAALGMRDAAYQSITPAIERVVLWLEEMKGWAMCDQSHSGPTLHLGDIEQCIRICQLLIIRSNDVEGVCGTEERKFGEFCRWIRHECEVLNAKDGNSESKLIAKYDILHAAACLEEGLKFRSMDRVLSREAQNLNEDALKPLTWSYEADRQRLLAIQQAVREGKPASRTKTSEIDLPGLPSLLENATRKLGQMFEQSLCFVDIAIAKAEAVKIGQKTPASISSRLGSDGTLYICGLNQPSDATDDQGLIFLSKISKDDGLAFANLSNRFETLEEITIASMDFFDDVELVLVGKFAHEGLLATIHYHESDWQTDPDHKPLPLTLGRTQSFGTKLLPRALALNGRQGRRIAAVLGSENQLEVFDLEEVEDEEDADDVAMQSA